MTDRFRVVPVPGGWSVEDAHAGVREMRVYQHIGWAARRASKLADLALRTALATRAGITRQP